MLKHSLTGLTNLSHHFFISCSVGQQLSPQNKKSRSSQLLCCVPCRLYALELVFWGEFPTAITCLQMAATQQQRYLAACHQTHRAGCKIVKCSQVVMVVASMTTLDDIDSILVILLDTSDLLQIMAAFGCLNMPGMQQPSSEDWRPWKNGHLLMLKRLGQKFVQSSSSASGAEL